MIKGNVRTESEGKSFNKKVGLFTGKVVSVNPDAEWLTENGMEPKEGSKATEYLGESKEGNTTLRLSFWLKEENSGQLFNASYYLENKEKTKSDDTKKQYLNTHGVSTWVDTEENLPAWFTKYEYRVAKVGEADLYNFLKTWLSGLKLEEADAVLHLDWKRLMSGNVKEIADQINGEYSRTVLMPAVIQTKDTDNGVKEYQKVFNKAVTYESNMRYFINKDFSEEYITEIKNKKPKDLKPFEKFIKIIVDDQHGCKDFYSLKPLHDYDPKENIVGKREISSENADY